MYSPLQSLPKLVHDLWFSHKHASTIGELYYNPHDRRKIVSPRNVWIDSKDREFLTVQFGNEGNRALIVSVSVILPIDVPESILIWDYSGGLTSNVVVGDSSSMTAGEVLQAGVVLRDQLVRRLAKEAPEGGDPRALKSRELVAAIERSLTDEGLLNEATTRHIRGLKKVVFSRDGR